jgi:hypothetical protein
LSGWEEKDIPQHLGTIRDRLLANEQEIGRLLGLYQQVLTGSTSPRGSVKATGDRLQAELQLAGIVRSEQGTLQVANPIYRQIFDHAWVDAQLAQTRPYTRALQAWTASDGQDESRLLSGAALAEALQWASHRHLSDLDYRFLSASQAQESRWTHLELEAQTKANQLLATAQRKARKVIWLGYLSLGTCLGISMVALVMTLWKSR